MGLYQIKRIACTVAAITLTLAVMAQRKPNVIYIYADDMGYGELGCYGQQKIKTPNLDKLAAEGMRFTQHYTSTPVCAPARCMLLTGKNGGHSFIRGNYELGGFADSTEGGQMPLPEGTFTIAKLMKQAGYVTGATGKWGLGMSNSSGAPQRQGFDYFYGYLDQKQAHNYYPTHLWENDKPAPLNNPFIFVHRPPLQPGAPDSAFEYFRGNDYAVNRIADKALDFITQHRNEPFFLYLPITLPHVSLQAPDSVVQPYIGQFDEPVYYGENGYTPTKHPYATYAGMITYLDKQVGRVMALLQQLGLDNNTLVLFSSDNGATFDVGGVKGDVFQSTGGLRGRKQDLYEGGIREPFIARWPGKIPAGVVSDEISVQYDIMPTLGELTGTKAPNADGISLLPVLLGKKTQQHHPYIYFEFPEKTGQVAVRMGKWKGVKSNMKKNLHAPWEIYDLDTDRQEAHDVAAQHPDLAARFEAIVQQEHEPAVIQEWEFVAPKLHK
ncbi:arylsulfatase [Deminuibacter soli]|uniref:N-acetylgalactosamine-6-sulfatase n=1 Tax=Deminuibacter soli TaxID=2291815 RepID=A0A3E1NKX1_9BACT|nr:arylsulfatase [Deminuibacter soli]RFM28576.1 N-acetylgalactosamine-6-sulfatase [Deminuibacter soli]